MVNVVIIGYSGHSYVAIDVLQLAGFKIIGYCENEEAPRNPFDLKYLGQEKECSFSNSKGFIAIGNASIRERIYTQLPDSLEHVIAIHPLSQLSTYASIGVGTLICANATINPFAKIGKCVIINTSSIVEHECHIDDFAHVAPGAVLAGNVKVGKRSFIGANATVIQGITIGDDVIVGAGSVIINDIPDNCTAVGNPGKVIKRKK